MIESSTSTDSQRAAAVGVRSLDNAGLRAESRVRYVPPARGSAPEPRPPYSSAPRIGGFADERLGRFRDSVHVFSTEQGQGTVAHTPLEPAQGPPRAAGEEDGRRTVAARLWAAVTGTVGVVSGLAPHVLHHVGPVAGAALIAGVGGTVLFGALGLLLSVPFLLRLHRRSGSWRRPIAALLVFAAMFTLSATVIGPAIRGDDDAPVPAVTTSPGHAGHHK